MEIFCSSKRLSKGFAHRFRPTYAGANVGHPSVRGGIGVLNVTYTGSFPAAKPATGLSIKAKAAFAGIADLC
jgi:hypothetical protein